MRSLFVIVIVGLLLETGSLARAEDDVDAQAQTAFKAGVEHFKAERYQEAAAAFYKAIGLKYNWKIQFNIGQSEAASKRYGLALKALEQYLAEGGDDVPPDRRDAVLAEVRRLRDMVASLEVHAPEGCLVFVDSVERGQAPLKGTLMVSAGIEHSVLVKQKDKIVLERVIRLNGKQSLVLEVKEEESSKTLPPKKTQPDAARGEEDVVDPIGTDKDKQKSTYRTAGWATLGVGTAVLVGAAVTGGVALSMNNELKGDCGDGTCLKEERQDDEDKRDSIATASSVLFGVGGAAAAAGVVLLALGYFDKEQDKDEKESRAAVAFTPSFGPRFLGAAIQGRF